MPESPINVHGPMGPIQKVLESKVTIILLDEVMPNFGLSDWNQLNVNPSLQFVVSIRHLFDQSRFSTSLESDKIHAFENSLVCILSKRLRCSKQITDLVFHLMIHSRGNHNLKSFHHSNDSFNGQVPEWLDVDYVEDFIDYANTNYTDLDPKMVIYDPTDDRFTLQPLLKFCSDKNWPCYSLFSIVGSEASTVIIFNLKEFNFEAFTRPTSHLIFITIKGTGKKNR